MSLGRFLFLFLIAAAAVLPLRLWVVEPIYIATPSMEPTLPVGRHLFADKITPRLRRLRRGDIVVFRPPVDNGAGREFVKRVIAVGGETVELREKKVLVDGTLLDEPYAQHTRAGERLQGDTMEPVTVPQGALFVLGDNRDESEDSSVWKDESGNPVRFLPEKNVVGIVRGIY